MIEFNLPNGSEYRLHHAVFDYNGTLAEDGLLAEETKQLLRELTQQIRVIILTADTFGQARTQLADLPDVALHIIDRGNEAAQKRDFVRSCGGNQTVCFGNGANDLEMFGEARLAVAVIGPEGVYQPTLVHAHVAVTSAKSAITLLLKPSRLIATLRA